MGSSFIMSDNYRLEDALRDIYKELKDINNRLSVIETQMADSCKKLSSHDDQIHHLMSELGSLEKEVGILQGGWKTYLVIGGIAGTLGAIVGAFVK